MNVKGNTQHLSFLAFHGQAAKHEIQHTILRRQKREDNEILLLGQEGQNTNARGVVGTGRLQATRVKVGGTRCKKEHCEAQNTIL